MNTFMKNSFFCLILLLFSCIEEYENREKPFLVVINTLSENIAYLKNRDSNEFKTGPRLGQSPNQVSYKQDYIFVINSLSNSVMKFDSFLNLKNEFGVLESSNPYKGVVIGENIYITSYLLHSVMVYNHNTGKKIANIQLNPVLYNGKTYYPFPCGICSYNNYIFVACKDTLDVSAKNAIKGRVAVININKKNVIGYIQSDGYNTNNVLIYKDFLYIISTGSYETGYNEDGIIEKVDLINFDFDSFVYTKSIVATNNSFGNIVFTPNFVFTGNIGNSKIIKYDLNWNQIDYKILKPTGFSFISGMNYYDNKLYLLEYNGSTLYIIEPFSFVIKKSIKPSFNQYGDPVDLCIIE